MTDMLEKLSQSIDARGKHVVYNGDIARVMTEHPLTGFQLVEMAYRLIDRKARTEAAMRDVGDLLATLLGESIDRADQISIGKPEPDPLQEQFDGFTCRVDEHTLSIWQEASDASKDIARALGRLRDTVDEFSWSELDPKEVMKAVDWAENALESAESRLCEVRGEATSLRDLVQDQ